MSIRKHCRLREEVAAGDLEDTIFAADFGDLVSGDAPKVYGVAKTFFQNTHPAQTLKKVVGVVFERLANPKESGATVRLSTGFGGGKTHTLMAMWHLGRNIDDRTLGAELLPAAGRPEKVTVVGVDAQKAGTPVFRKHKKVETHSLWGDIAFQLGGEKDLRALGDRDDAEKVPDEDFFKTLFPDGPVLILLDEIVVYMATLSERGQSCILSFLRKLTSIAEKRPQTVLVVTDPSQAPAYSKQAAQIDRDLMTAAANLGAEFGRTMSNYDPIGNEAPQVIARRLFEKIDPTVAQNASATYLKLYERVSKDIPGALPTKAADFAKRIVECYPFHPRLLDTAQDRLAAIQEFNKSRGTLRLFARILRDLWDSKADVDLITAGDVDWSSHRIQADLLHRLGRDNFKPAVTADIEKHAAELDGSVRGVHRRAASALLLESLPLEASSGMDAAELTLAILRPDESGQEPAEAIERLTAGCWHTYPMAGGRGWQFRYEPNINRQIEQRAGNVPLEDARQHALNVARAYFTGATFKLVALPTNARQVPDSAELQLALCEDERVAKSVCLHNDDRDPKAPMARRFINSIVAVAPSPSAFGEAIRRAQRIIAADQLKHEHQSGDTSRIIRDQFSKVRPELDKALRLQTYRAFDRIILPEAAYSIDEKYQVSEDEMLKHPQGQACVRKFLEEKELIYRESEALDPHRFARDILPGATPLPDQPEVFTTRAVHERLLGAEGLRLIPNQDFSRETIRRAVAAGKIVIRLEDGRVHDGAGCVEGLPGQRRRSTKALSVFALDEKVHVTPSGSPVAQEWVSEDKPAPGGVKPKPPPPPPPQGEVHTNDWNEALAYAKERPVLNLDLIAKTPAAASQLPSLVPPLGADRVSLAITVAGELKDGGTMSFMCSDVKPAHPLKPLQIAQSIYTGFADSTPYSAQMNLNFGKTGRPDMASHLKRLREHLPDNVDLLATFGKPGGRA